MNTANKKDVVIRFRKEVLRRADIANLLMANLQEQLITVPMALALSRKLGIIPGDVYKLFHSGVFHETELGEFMNGYLKAVVKYGAEGHF